MIDLKKIYNERVKNLEPTDYLSHVGHTINGEAISSSDFNYLTDKIIKALDLSCSDDVLDLCCGNGIITKKLSTHCNSVCAIDLSSEMISIANTYNSSYNVNYINCDIWEIYEFINKKRTYSKVLIFGALQHFKETDLDNLLNLIKSHCNDKYTILLGFIPDTKHKWKFHNTLIKKSMYFYRSITKTDLMGTWWNRTYIKNICDQNELNCNFINIEEGQYGYPYRFHALISSR